ncbi:toprim domain-containing protein [Novosphingobium sp. FSW06-99]|uniref:DUF7146 domain-containing protein n=1 Tax=Novosphingobium sp. FSW06-99 TaxID=1739113 RepID=UPI00076C5122|nr:toprim domain-containing protein [Novosphingobium sp. FSW06-99]KUR80925.1 hypothetical protein AQZ49_02560 [Novosphingobium sp. FSW06-99]
MTLLSVTEIERELRANALAIGRQCLPGAVEEGSHLCAGSIAGEPGQSLKLAIRGDSKGWWRDYAGTDGGDMLDLIMATQGCRSKGEAVAIAKQWLGKDDDFGRVRHAPPSADELAARAERLRLIQEREAAKAAQTRTAKIKGARALYLHALARGIAGTPVEAYLQGRGLRAGDRWPGALRFHPEVYNKELGDKAPAMLAPMFLADGTHVATHRTWLQPCARRGWTKLDVGSPKMVIGPMRGAFVPINKGASGKPMSAMPEDEPVYMTEGIEDAIVVRMARPEARIICAVNLPNMGMVVLPAAARRLTIVADRDTKPTAIDALERAIAAQQARGLDVRLVMPPVGFKDLNEWLLMGHAAREA